MVGGSGVAVGAPRTKGAGALGVAGAADFVAYEEVVEHRTRGWCREWLHANVVRVGQARFKARGYVAIARVY